MIITAFPVGFFAGLFGRQYLIPNERHLDRTTFPNLTGMTFVSTGIFKPHTPDFYIPYFTLFEILLEKIKTDVLKFLLNMNLVFSDKTKDKAPPVEKTRKVGRNHKCPCGAGKKFKHCCGSV